MFQNTPIGTLQHNLREELILQKSNYIFSINTHSPKLLQISLLTARVPALDCDVVLTAPAAAQANFLAWRRGVWGWRRKCVCGNRFDRGHTWCMASPAIYLNEMQRRVYNLGHQVLGTSVKYTLVDFLLNEGLWDKARNILDFWTLSISHLLRFNPLSA